MDIEKLINVIEGQTPESLELITEDIINKAFEAAVKDSQLERGKFVRLTSEYHETVKDLCNTEFAKREPLSLATGMKWESELFDEFWLRSLRQNLSIGIVNKENGELMATRLIRLEKLDAEQPAPEDMPDEATRTGQEFTMYCDNEANYEGHFPTKEVFHFIGMIVPEKYARQGLATKTIEFCVKFIRNLEIGEKFIKVETTSPYTRKIYDRLAFKSMFEIPFENYKVNGEQVLKTFGNKWVYNVYGMQLP